MLGLASSTSFVSINCSKIVDLDYLSHIFISISCSNAFYFEILGWYEDGEITRKYT